MFVQADASRPTSSSPSRWGAYSPSTVHRPSPSDRSTGWAGRPGGPLHRPGIQAFEPRLLEGKALAAANISQGQHRRSRLMTTIALVAGGGQ